MNRRGFFGTTGGAALAAALQSPHASPDAPPVLQEWSPGAPMPAYVKAAIAKGWFNVTDKWGSWQGEPPPDGNGGVLCGIYEDERVERVAMERFGIHGDPKRAVDEARRLVAELAK